MMLIAAPYADDAAAADAAYELSHCAMLRCRC